MELKNCEARLPEDVATEIKINKVEEVSNIDLEILYNSCIEVDPFFISTNEA